MQDQIICPHCKKPVEISQALRHQIEEKVRVEAEEKAFISAQKKAKEEFDLKFRDTANELDEAKERNKKLSDQLLETNKLIRGLKVQSEQHELENQKKLVEERERIKEEISKFEEEKSKLKFLELNKQLEDTKRALSDAQRKAEQKSQQLQGEVLELDLESQLKESFPTDEISPVPKGIEGADLLQKVKNKHGQSAGVIVWETKRTQSWSKQWLAKLREDTRKLSATASILASDALPNGVDTFSLIDGVWVSSYKYAIHLATVLRVGILQVAIAKSAAAHKDEKLEELYKYLTNDSFRHRFEAQVESIIELRSDLEVEQRSTVRAWKKREAQINKMRNNLASMYGELQGIVGPSLPTLPSLDSRQLLETNSQSRLLDE